MTALLHYLSVTAWIASLSYSDCGGDSSALLSYLDCGGDSSALLSYLDCGGDSSASVSGISSTWLSWSACHTAVCKYNLVCFECFQRHKLTAMRTVSSFNAQFNPCSCCIHNYSLQVIRQTQNLMVESCTASASVYYCEWKVKNKKQGRPGNEATLVLHHAQSLFEVCLFYQSYDYSTGQIIALLHRYQSLNRVCSLLVNCSQFPYIRTLYSCCSVTFRDDSNKEVVRTLIREVQAINPGYQAGHIQSKYIYALGFPSRLNVVTVTLVLLTYYVIQVQLYTIRPRHKRSHWRDGESWWTGKGSEDAAKE